MTKSLHHELEALRDSLLSGEMPRSLRWNRAVNLITHLGFVEGHGDHEYLFAVGTQRATFKRPADHELRVEDISRLRKFLRDASPNLVVRDPPHPSRVVVIIDQHAAHIYQDLGNGQPDEHTVRPHNPFRVDHHTVPDHTTHERVEGRSEENAFYQDVANELAYAAQIVILGHGKGTGTPAKSLKKYLESHDPDLFLKLVDTEEETTHAITDAAMEVAAKAHMPSLHS